MLGPWTIAATAICGGTVVIPAWLTGREPALAESNDEHSHLKWMISILWILPKACKTSGVREGLSKASWIICKWMKYGNPLWTRVWMAGLGLRAFLGVTLILIHGLIWSLIRLALIPEILPMIFITCLIMFALIRDDDLWLLWRCDDKIW